MSIRSLTALFIPFDAVGHVNPLVALSETLLAAGHQTVFLMTNKWRPLLDTTHPNTTAIFYGSQPERPESVPAEPAQFLGQLLLQLGLLAESSPVDKMLTNVHHLLAHWTAQLPTIDAYIERAISEVRPDVIVVDYPLAVPSIERSTVPYVCVNVCNPLRHILDPKTPPFGTGYAALGDQSEWTAFTEKYLSATRDVWHRKSAYFVSQGCEPLQIGDHFKHSPYLNVYQFPIELDYQMMRPNPAKHYRFDNFISTGGADDPAFEIPKQLANRPGKLVYFSLGSMGATDVHNMKRLVSILSKSKHRFIVSKGPKHDTYDLPDNMYGKKYLPQQQIVPTVDLIITHNGNNTFCEGFAAGKPMIVLPLQGDQYSNAQRVDELGFGIRLDAYKCTEGQLLAAIDRLLNDKELHEKLATIADRIKRDNSIAMFPQLVESIVFNE